MSILDDKRISETKRDNFSRIHFKMSRDEKSEHTHTHTQLSSYG